MAEKNSSSKKRRQELKLRREQKRENANGSIIRKRKSAR